jgi:hypothetical protein
VFCILCTTQENGRYSAFATKSSKQIPRYLRTKVKEKNLKGSHQLKEIPLQDHSNNKTDHILSKEELQSYIKQSIREALAEDQNTKL